MRPVAPSRSDALQALVGTPCACPLRAPRRAHIEAVVAWFHRWALARLRQLTTRKRLVPDSFGLSLPDLALDCVAELFARDEAGRFPVLERAFAPCRGQPADAWERRARAVVWHAVRQALVRRHGEERPAITRLTRQLKEAAAAHGEVALLCHRGRAALALQTRLAHHPEGDTNKFASVEAAWLERALVPYLTGAFDAPTVLDAFVAVLDAHGRDARPAPPPGAPASAAPRCAPVAVLARAALQARTRLHRARQSCTSDLRQRQHEALALVERAVAAVSHTMHPAYVGKGKVEASTFAAYLAGVRDRLAQRVAPEAGERPPPGEVVYAAQSAPEAPPGDPASLAACVRRHLPGLSEADYRAAHRTRVEYLHRLVRGHLAALAEVA